MNTHFTSDPHFGHHNVIEYSKRPFKDVDHMNQTLIRNWNAAVKNDDTVYCVGDWSLNWESVEKIVNRLNGTKYLIVGNHDRPHRSFKGKTPAKQEEWFKKYEDQGFMKVDQHCRIVGYFSEEVRLYHLPYYDPEDCKRDDPTAFRHKEDRLEDDGILLIHGHQHERMLYSFTPKGTLQVNVGIDAPNAPWSGAYRPATLIEVQQVIDEAYASRT